VVAFYMFGWPLLARMAGGKSFLPQGGFRVALWTSDFWATFPQWGISLATFAVCGFLSVWLLGAKGFCTYACPYGAMFARLGKLAPLRIVVSDACEQCGHCTAVCTSNVRVHQEVRDF